MTDEQIDQDWDDAIWENQHRDEWVERQAQTRRAIAGLQWYRRPGEDWGRRAGALVLLEAVPQWSVGDGPAAGKWMTVGSFLSLCLEWNEEGRAEINWEKTTRYAHDEAGWASSGELSVLRLACLLAGHMPTDLDERDTRDWTWGWLVQPLDGHSSELLQRAVLLSLTGDE